MREKTSVYDCIGAAGYELCHPDDTRDWDTANTMTDGSRRKASWRPFAVHLVHLDQGRRLAEADAPWFGDHALVLRESAVGAMGDMLTDSGEPLPLLCDEAKLWLYNPTVVLDALDEGASTVLRFDDGRIMYIQKHAFRPEIVRGVSVFKLATVGRSSVFFGPAFVQRWQAARLTGLEFKKVWSG
jgi:hypothetical protein